MDSSAAAYAPLEDSGETRHGSIFIIQTPDPGGQIYEITVGKPKPSVLVFDLDHGRRTDSTKERSTERLNVRSEMLPWIYSTGYTAQVERQYKKWVKRILRE